MTYAFYDNGSTGCFVTSSLLDELDVRGTDVSLQLRTMHGEDLVASRAVDDLLISDLEGNNEVLVRRAYSQSNIPVSHEQIPQRGMLSQWTHLQSVANCLPPFFPSLQIGLLIGSNCPMALEPLQVCPPGKEGPYAVRLRHGWTVLGPTSSDSADQEHNISAHRIMTNVSERIALNDLVDNFNRDFLDPALPDQKGFSQDDKLFLSIVENGICFQDGHYQIPLPLRDDSIMMPDNRSLALKRAFFQRSKMLKDDHYRQDYVDFVEAIVAAGYASPVPDAEMVLDAGNTWYLPHHGVYNPNKPKIRVVYDCSAAFMGTSLNNELLQGSNLTNSLIGVLIRFRLEPVAFQADIEKMFCQVTVPPEQRCRLRFFWWPQGDLDRLPQEYQMNMHLFGATSSPSVVNFALRRVAEDVSCSPEVMSTILNHFYVDDVLRSVGSVESAVSLIRDLVDALLQRGFRLSLFRTARMLWTAFRQKKDPKKRRGKILVMIPSLSREPWG
jgi:hypothetical protein